MLGRVQTVKEPELPETLKPGYELVVSIYLKADQTFSVDWNLFEFATGWDCGSTWMVKDTDNPAKAVREAQKAIRAALHKHIMDAP